MKIQTVLICLSLALLSCDDSTSSADPIPDNPSSSSQTPNSSSSIHSQSSSSLSPQSSSSTSSDNPAALFQTRIPDSTSLECEYSGTVKFSQSDWICSFAYLGKQAVLYVQSTPVQCVEIMSPTAEFKTDKALLFVDGQLQDLSSAQYDWGGNHQNDHLEFSVGGKILQIYHSSFGFGWRACQPMDCLKIYQADGTTVETDGCTSDRTVPVVCREADPQGKFGDFTESFAKCMGDDS